MNKLLSRQARMKEAKRLVEQLQHSTIINKRLAKDLIKNMSDIVEERRHGIKDRSYETYLASLNIFAAWYRPACILNPTISPKEFLYGMMDDRKHPNYIKKFYVFLKSVFKELVKRGQYTENPFDSIKVKGVKKKSLLPFTTEQIAELKKLIEPEDPNMWFACELGYYCYFRPAELRLLQVKHINFHSMTIDVDFELTKDDDTYQKLLPVQLHDKIKTLRSLPPDWYLFTKNKVPGKRMTNKNNLWYRHSEFLKRLNYYNGRYSLYSWPHTGMQAAILAGVPAKQVQLQKGHSDLRVLDMYLQHMRIADCQQLKNNFPGI